MPKSQHTSGDDVPHRSYVLWRARLPNGDRAAVYVQPNRRSVDVIGYRNSHAYRLERCANLAEAHQRGWDWRVELVSRFAHLTEYHSPARGSSQPDDRGRNPDESQPVGSGRRV